MNLTIVVQIEGGEGQEPHTLSSGQETGGVGEEIWRAVCTKQVNTVIIAIIVIINVINNTINITTIIRLETLESLDRLKELEEHDDLKSKLLFSVIVVRL